VDADTTAPGTLSPSAYYHEGCYYYLLEEGKCGNLIAQEGNKRTLNRPKTGETTDAFGALFSLQCVRFITRGSLFIGDPWV
jgi:hypothetical protein